MEKRLKLSSSLAISALILNFFLINWFGVPISVPMSIMAFALALTTKTEEGFPRGAKKSIILSIIAFVFGIGNYMLTLSIIKAVQDPATSHAFTDQLRRTIELLPENMKPYLNELYGL